MHGPLVMFIIPTVFLTFFFLKWKFYLIMSDTMPLGKTMHNPIRGILLL